MTLLDNLRQRLPGFDPAPVLSRQGRASNDELRAELFHHGADPADVDKVAPRRRRSDHDLAAAGLTATEIVELEPDVAPSRARRIAGLDKPLSKKSLLAALDVVDHGMSIAEAAERHGLAVNTVRWAVRAFEFQRTS
jgi:hypothetical protein